MKKQPTRKSKKRNLKKSPIFLIALLNFLIIIVILIYIIYLRFIPYKTIIYDGYAVSGKDLATNLLNSSFDVDKSIEALEVKDQDEIYQNLKSYYIGASKEKEINLNYPIYVNDSLALYNLSSEVTLITDFLQTMEGYDGFTLTQGALYNANTLERADYHDYILMKNADGMYINTKEMKIKTTFNKYTIKMNSIINFTDEFITYYTLEDGEFVYNKILDVDMNSELIIKDLDKKYTYKEFLIGLNIIREEIKEEDKIEENTAGKENVINEEKEENTLQVPESNLIIEENIIQDETNNTQEEIEETEKEPGKWQKPTVTTTGFVANTYTATTEVEIKDPSKAIYKAVTFSFYIDDEIQFRSSTRTTGSIKITKLLPNTTYHVEGIYQYTNEKGGIVEVKFFEQDFTTLGTNNIKPIDLSYKNGQIYSSKIEILDLEIVSNIEDEAISGVNNAKIFINGDEYSINTSALRSILKGDKVKYENSSGIESSTKYKYEFKFYDTAGNEMKLNNNTGSTRTAKMEPSVKVKVDNQEVVSVTINLTLNNPDKVELLNYRYEIYTSKGERIKKERLAVEDKSSIFLDSLNPNETYTIKTYADYDIDDGNGIKKDQEIANSSFTTKRLSELGSVQINVESTNIEANRIELDVLLNKKTDNRLIRVLKEIKIEIKDEEGKGKEFYITDTDIDKISIEELNLNVDNLNSNTKYNINITSIAKQGDVEEEVRTTYTLKSITTRKLPAKYKITNQVVTYNLIDFDILFEDIDGASLNGEFRIEVRDEMNVLVKSQIVKANKTDRCTIDNLTKGKTYEMECFALNYNETEDEAVDPAKPIGEIVTFETKGLGGTIELTSLVREENETINLIDVESENNWYSKCFGVLENVYSLDEFNRQIFNIESTRNYGKKYNKDTNELILTANQCYVYDFSKYIGEEVTLSFEATASSDLVEIFIQEGKEIGTNLTKIEQGTYNKKHTIPEDGYLGFYIKPGDNQKDETATIRNLQVRLDDVTDYETYKYKLKSNIKVNFEDSEFVTINGNDKQVQYSVRILQNDKVFGEVNQYTITPEQKKDANGNSIYEYQFYNYEIVENNDNLTYKIELYIEINNREYVLDSVLFECKDKDNTVNEIKSISSIKEYKDIQPYGKYMILKDLDLTNETSSSEYTFGNPKIAFHGTIDFNGKTIKKDTMLSTGYKNTSYLFYELSDKATIKNTVLDLELNNDGKVEDDEALYAKDERDGYYGLFLYNKGNVSNLMLNLVESSETGKRYIGLIGYENRGLIDKFIINLKTTLYGRQYVSGGCLYSSGIIQNGYMYDGSGDNQNGHIEINSYITQGEDSYREVAGLVCNLKAGGVLQRVYNLTEIRINHHYKTNSYGANIVYKVDSGATVNNVYTTKGIYTIDNSGRERSALLNFNNMEIYDGPNIIYNSGVVNNSYYFFYNTYNESTFNVYEQISQLNNVTFQERILNDVNYQAFDVSSLVLNGYYPQLMLNSCMPKQPSIKIVDSIASGNEMGIDVLEAYNIVQKKSEESINEKVYEDLLEKETEDNKIRIEEKIKQEANIEEINDIWEKENCYLAYFEIYNPYGLTIKEINIEYMKTNIIYQKKVDKNPITIVYVLLKEPTTFVDEYTVKSAVATALGNIEYIDEEIDIKIDAPCYKHITGIEDWKSIYNTDVNGVSGLIQNYIIDTDELDFKNGNWNDDINNSIFNGKLLFAKGIEQCTIKNVETSNVLFAELGTSLQNFNFENINIFFSNSQSKFGIIGEIKEAAEVKNITVKNLKINFSEAFVPSGDINIGGICGKYSSENNMENVSIEGFELTFNEKENNTQMNSYYIGGICGNLDVGNKTKVNIDNTNVKELKIDMGNDITFKGESYIGGICGAINSKGSITNSYTKVINIVYNSTSGNNAIGGIVGINKASDSTIQNCFVQGLSISNGAKVRGVGGILGIGEKDTDIQSCYTAGEITTNSAYTGGVFGRIDGSSVIKYCYSLVSIILNENIEKEYIGGIGGYYSNSISNNLYLGNINIPKEKVTPTFKTDYTKRIIGNNENTNTSRNYAFEGQIMGVDTKTDLSLGAICLKEEELFDVKTYGESMLSFNNNYYEYSETTLNEKYFPKLHTNKEKDSVIDKIFIEAQEDNILPTPGNNWDYGVEITKVQAKYKTATGYVPYRTDKDVEEGERTLITLTIQNKGHAKLTGISISNMSVEKIEVVDDKTRTQYIITAKPEKYLNGYRITEIIYQRVGKDENGQEFEIGEEVIKKLETSKTFWTTYYYKTIESEADWKNKMTTYEENFVLIKDVTFTKSENIVASARINNLIGSNGSKKSIVFNIESSIQNAFIDYVKELKDIKFDNFNITGNARGLINTASGSVINNCEFHNITIDTQSTSSIGIIGTCYSGNIKNIILNNITINANAKDLKNSVGGLFGIFHSGNGSIDNIEGKKITINSTGSCVGGIIGRVNLRKNNSKC